MFSLRAATRNATHALSPPATHRDFVAFQLSCLCSNSSRFGAARCATARHFSPLAEGGNVSPKCSSWADSASTASQDPAQRLKPFLGASKVFIFSETGDRKNAARTVKNARQPWPPLCIIYWRVFMKTTKLFSIHLLQLSMWKR